jgi:MYXO-CTERM domain-containing protein
LSESLGREWERRRQWSSLPLVHIRTWPVAALLLVFGTSACGDAGVGLSPAVETWADPVIGGIAADDTDFPAVVSLGGCSGTLVHPTLVVYAEHCGTAMGAVRFGAHAETPKRLVNVERCHGFPGAKLGDGSDLAFCVLAEPVLDVEPERVMAGCELDTLAIGQPVSIVGFGIDRDGGAYGEKRHGLSRIDAIGDELILRGGADTCRGDSGGPVFTNRVEPNGVVQRRLIGVTSAGSEAECGRGIGHYVNVTAKLGWLENASQLDLTPCFNEGTWSPTPACAATSSSVPASGGEPQHRHGDAPGPARLASCGSAFDAELDAIPPNVEWLSPPPPVAHYELSAGATFAELELAVQATDDGWGVQRVSFTLLDEVDQVLFERVDEVAPYGLPTFRLPEGRFILDARALDFAGNATSARVSVQVASAASLTVNPAGGCAVSPRDAKWPHWLVLLLVLLATRARRATKREPEHSR